jgi:uncharacterized phage-associated protein
VPTPPYEAGTIARWFLAWARFDEEGALSNLKLQKLLYYAQGHYMAHHGGQPLFADEIQAWGHGPVVPGVYHAYKHYGSGSIPLIEEFDFEQVDTDANEWLAAVWRTFGAMSAWRLREMTHAEPPWRDTYRDGSRGLTIPKETLHRYFGGLYPNVQTV